MVAEPQTHIADDLARIHKVVTRSLVVGRARGVDFALDGFPDATARAGFLDYARCALAVLRSHHDLVAAIDRALGPADQLELGRAVGEFAAQNSKPEELWEPMTALLIAPTTLS
jgi:hypothetical protein